MSNSLNALEKAVVENNDTQIIHHIKNGLRISNLSVLENVENIRNKKALYLLIKYGISKTESEKTEEVLANLASISNPSEALMIFREKPFFESAANPELKNAICNGDIDALEQCFEKNIRITELDTIIFSMALAGYDDSGVRRIFNKALTKKSRCYFLLKLVEAAKSFGECRAGEIVAHYADILEDILSSYTSEELEQAIKNIDNQEIIIRIAEDDLLSKPELLISKNFFLNISFSAVMFLFEIGITPNVKKQAIHLLQEKFKQTGENWLQEEIDLLKSSLTHFPDKLSSMEIEFENAIRNGDNKRVFELIENNICIQRPDVIVDLSFTKLSVKTMIAVVTRALSMRVAPHAFKQLGQIISYTEHSDNEYSARIMVMNLILQVAFGNMTWENSQDVTALYPMDDSGDNAQDDFSVNNSPAEVESEESTAEKHLWGYDNITLQKNIMLKLFLSNAQSVENL